MLELSNVLLIKQLLAAIKIKEAAIDRCFFKKANSKKSRQNPSELILYLYATRIRMEWISRLLLHEVMKKLCEIVKYF